ncbi:MAG: four helix bundle protein [Pseudomonadota bacterium]
MPRIIPAALFERSNLAEGRGKSSIKDPKRIFEIAFGSLKETQSILHITNSSLEIVKLADQTAAHLFKLLQSMK